MAATHAQTVLGLSPTMFLRLGEASGTTAADSSGNGHAGSYAGTYTLGQADPLIGDGDTAVWLKETGTPGTVTVPHAAALNLSTTSADRWSVEFLVARPSTVTATYPPLMSKGVSNSTTAGTAGFLFFVSGSAIYYKQNNAQAVVVSGVAWSSTFQHVVVTWDGAHLTGYLNGSVTAQTSFGSYANTNTASLVLNSSGTGGQPGNYTYDEVAFYPSALTQANVTSLYQSLGATGGATGSLTLSGSGTLTLAGTATQGTALSGSLALSGSGSLAFSGATSRVNAALALAGAGSLALLGRSSSPSRPVIAAVAPKDPWRGSLALWYSVDASVGGATVSGATDLRPVGGTITDTTKPGARRTLSLDLAPEPGLYDRLAPYGTTLTVTAHLRHSDRNVLDVPMGVFDVDSQTLSEGGGKLSLTAPDKWQRVVRAKFIGPTSSSAGIPVTQQIVLLIQGALGSSEEVVINSTSQAVTPALTWTDSDRAKAILDLAAGAGLWVFFDRNGTATIADIPTVGSSADYLLDAGPSGVLISLDRQRSRQSTYNVVVVNSSAAAGAAFPAQTVFDNDPSSPTYAGPDPVNHPEQAGPFGVSVYHFDTPLTLDIAGAQKTGAAILAKVVGLASQGSVSVVPNPAVDAFSVVDVLPPRERYDIARVVERHIVDTVTHALDVTQPMHIDLRSTRTDAYT